MAGIIDFFADLLLVPKCGACNCLLEKSDAVLCDTCRRKYDNEKAVYCDNCGMEISICRCIPKKLRLCGVSDYRKAVIYKSTDNGIVRSIIYSVKRRHIKKLVKFLAFDLADISDGIATDGAVVTYAPRSIRARDKYGYDHGRLLAQYFAEKQGLRFEKLIRRKLRLFDREQKKLSSAKRSKNIKGAFKAVHPEKAEGKRIILVDDVVTSGATMGECATLLFSMGAESVKCVSIAYTGMRRSRRNN